MYVMIRTIRKLDIYSTSVMFDPINLELHISKFILTIFVTYIELCHNHNRLIIYLKQLA